MSMTLMLGMCISMYANPDVTGKKKEKKEDVGTTITLVTSGTGDTKEEATKNALRSALEQTYGAFVSANSQVVNDELVKDEIVSISTGNIVSYEELSFIDSNPKQVTVSAVVSISRLQTYAQNKGMSAELAGNTFAMNLKMEELNKKNQDVALKHMLEQTKVMAQNLFDYELDVGDPEKTPNGVQVPVTIRIKANNNTISYYDYFHKTLTSLAVNKGNNLNIHGKQGVEIDGFKQFDGKGIVYELRGEARDPDTHNTIFEICEVIGSAVLNCEIVDNLGNVSGFAQQSNYSGVTRDYISTNKLSYTYHGGSGRSQQLMGYRDDYKSGNTMSGQFPIERLTRAGTMGFYFWMNTVRPKAGEKLYDTKLFLMYSVDEISKISKIEIRPKKLANDVSKQELLGLIEDLKEAEKCIDLYNDKSNSIEVSLKYLEKSYSLFKKIKANPHSVYIIKPADLDDYLDTIGSVLKKK